MTVLLRPAKQKKGQGNSESGKQKIWASVWFFYTIQGSLTRGKLWLIRAGT
jgi:hypothetical protein